MSSALAVAAFAWAGILASTQPRARAEPSSPRRPEITFDETRYDFGTVEEDAVIRHLFQFRNTGDETLEVKEANPTCSCTFVDGYSKTVESGKDGSIEAGLKLAGMRGRLTKTVIVTSNDPRKPTVHLVLVAEIKADITVLRSDNIWLGDLRPETHTNQLVEIKSSMAEPFEVVGIESGAPWMETEVVSSTTNTVTIQLSTRPPLPSGTSRTTVNVHTRFARHTNVPIRVAFRVPDTISLQPSRLMLVGSARQEISVQVRRNDGKEFHITGIQFVPKELSAAVTTNQAGTDYTLRFTARDGRQPADGTIEILTDEPTRPRLKLPYVIK